MILNILKIILSRGDYEILNKVKWLLVLHNHDFKQVVKIEKTNKYRSKTLEEKEKNKIRPINIYVGKVMAMGILL